MVSVRRIRRFLHRLRVQWVALFLLSLLAVVACSTATIKSGKAPLPYVEALPLPKLPDWIEQISPTGEAAPLAQIRIRFKEPLIPLESLDSPNQQDLLKKFELVPPLPGQFRFLTPKMVGFQADQAIPKATRVRVTLKAGLADLKNHRLAQDLAWTFNTEAIKLTDLPGVPVGKPNPENPPEPIALQPSLKFTSNVELDLNSLKDHVQFIPTNGKGIAAQATLEKQEAVPQSEPSPSEQFDPTNQTWIYNLAPQQALAKATPYRLEFSPGLRPAGGNLPSEAPFVTQVETYGPLAFQGLGYVGQPDAGGTPGRFVQGGGSLKFNNPLSAETASAAVKVSPAAKPGLTLVDVYEGDREIRLNPWALEPGTTYTVTVEPGLKDTFGQSLDQSVSVQYSTGDVAADLWAPTGLNIFPTGQNLQLNVSAVNLPDGNYRAAFTVLQPEDLVFFDTAFPGDRGSLLPKPDDWDLFKANGAKNQSADNPVNLRYRLGGDTGMLAYGIQGRTNAYQENGQQRWREPTYYGLVQLTNLGVFAQWFPEAGFVRVHHLSDGGAVKGATVEVYLSQLEAKSRSPVSPCATGKTDASGTLQLNRQALRNCMGGNAFTDAPKLLVVAREDRDWAFTRTLEYSGAYEYGLDSGWNSTKPESRGTLFSDRQLYQPGETAYFTGLATYLQNGKLQLDKKASYKITLISPSGQQTDLGNQTTNEFGTFSLELPIQAGQPLGYYNLQAKGQNGVELTGEFRIAEFKPPNFKTSLSLNQEFALPDQKLEASVQSNYLFGPPVQGGKVEYYVTRKEAEFQPKGWESFSFGRRWFWPEEAPSVSSDVLQGEQTLNDQGQSQQQFTIEKNLPYPMQYRVDAQVSDVSNLSVSDSKEFIALPGDRLVGLKSNFVADAGKGLPVEVIVTNPKGEAITGQKVRLELQAMNYSSVARVVEGSRTPQDQVEYKTVAQAEVNSGSTPQTVTLTPPDSGSYRIRANLANSQDEATATDVQIWATGAESVVWGNRYRNNRLEIKLDQETYQPGETATALIQSPYPEGELYFAVVRHNPIYQTVTKVQGGAPQIQFKVTPDMLPNAAVEAVLVRQGKPLNQVEPGSLDKLVRIGFAPFKTKLDDRYLKVETQATPTLAPGAEQVVQLQLKDDRGQPVKGQFTVMAVNEAILQLSGYRVPDLVETVYAEQPVSTRLSDNRPDVVLQPLSSPLEKGWGYGGGFSAGAANTRTRKDFRPVAYYNGAVATDASGQATVRFTLPDDLTTWRLMAVATDGNFRFGNGDTTFVTTKPLVTNPVLPQFARPGDRLEGGVAVTNSTGQSGNLSINGSIVGSVQFANNQPATLQTQAPTATEAYRFPLVVTGPGQARLQFSTQLNGATDAFEVPLEVKAQDVTEAVIESGVTENRATIPLTVDPKVATDAGGLELSLASTLIPAITAPARQVFDETDLPFLEPAASQLTIAANLQTLSQKLGQSLTGFNPGYQATQAVERLQKLQKPDGGFAAWPGQEKSDPFLTAYAARAMALANRGFTGAQALAALQGNPGLENRLRGYLGKVLADPGQFDFCKEQACKNQLRLESLLALAELGDRRSDFLADLYAGRNELSQVNQFKLARYLSQFPEWQGQARTLANQLQETVYQTGRTATVNLPQGWQWLGSNTATQAQALRLFIAQKAKPDVVDRLLEGLLSQRRNGTWQTTYDNAEALTALVDYSNQSPTPPNFSATAQLAGKTLAQAQFQGYQKPSTEVKVAMADLPQGRHDLVLQKSGRGTLHYLAAYRYRLQGNQPGRMNGLRVTRVIRPANADQVLYKAGLVAPEPLKVSVGQVYDVGLEVITDHPVDKVVITDPLPAGFEAVDNSFQTSTPYFQARGDSWQLGYKQTYADRVVAFGDRLEPGVYTLHYLVRSITPGTFAWPGAEAHLQYAPEEFGRSASSNLEVAAK